VESKGPSIGKLGRFLWICLWELWVLNKAFHMLVPAGGNVLVPAGGTVGSPWRRVAGRDRDGTLIATLEDYFAEIRK